MILNNSNGIEPKKQEAPRGLNRSTDTYVSNIGLKLKTRGSTEPVSLTWYTWPLHYCHILQLKTKLHVFWQFKQISILVMEVGGLLDIL